MHRRTLLATLSLLALAACGGAKTNDGKTLTVAATAVPHAEILESVKPTLAKEGVDLQIRVFNDYVQPNLQVEQKQIDVSYFETKPYLDEFNASRGTHLVPYAGVHVEPLGAYSRKWTSKKPQPTRSRMRRFVSRCMKKCIHRFVLMRD